MDPRAGLRSELLSLRQLVPRALRIAAADPRGVVGDALHPAERALVPGGDLSRRQQFIAGRTCARAALEELGVPAGPLLIGPDSAPCWPDGVSGSITHKPTLCIAVVGARPGFAGIGVDLEPARPLPEVVWGDVLTAAERSRLEAGGVGHGIAEARLVFSAKEAYYKCYRSRGGRDRIGFHDVEVEISGAQVLYRLRGGQDLPDAVGRCVVGRDWLITMAWC